MGNPVKTLIWRSALLRGVKRTHKTALRNDHPAFTHGEEGNLEVSYLMPQAQSRFILVYRTHRYVHVKRANNGLGSDNFTGYYYVVWGQSVRPDLVLSNS